MKIQELYEKEEQQADTALTHYILADFSKRLYKEIEKQGLQNPNRKPAHRGPLRYNVEAFQDSLGIRKNAFYQSEAIRNGTSETKNVDHVIPLAQLRDYFLKRDSNDSDFKKAIFISLGPTAKILKTEHMLLNKKGSKDFNSNLKFPFKRYAEVGLRVFRTDNDQEIDPGSWTLLNHYHMAYALHASKIEKLKDLYQNKSSVDYKVMCQVLKKMLTDLGCEN